MTYDPDDIFKSLEQAAEEWTQADYQYGLLEKMGEVLIAKMMLEARDEKVPASLCREAARARPEWEEHFRGELVARQKAERARARYRNLQALADARRTQESSTRALAR